MAKETRGIPGGEFDGKIAIVAGSASGIGRSIVLAFPNAGAKTMVADLNA
jgi:NAD(P)-dependent dehydrogenase (short-subunit alcohol dehydrogenase family)